MRYDVGVRALALVLLGAAGAVACVRAGPREAATQASSADSPAAGNGDGGAGGQDGGGDGGGGNSPANPAGMGRGERGTVGTDWPQACPVAKQGPCVSGSWGTVNWDLPSVFQTPHFDYRSKNPVSAEVTTAWSDSMEALWQEYTQVQNFPEPYCAKSEKTKVSVYFVPDGKGIIHDEGSNGTIPEITASADVISTYADSPSHLRYAFAQVLHWAVNGVYRYTAHYEATPYFAWFAKGHAAWLANRSTKPTQPVWDPWELINWPHLHVNQPDFQDGTPPKGVLLVDYIANKLCPATLLKIWTQSKKPQDPGWAEEDPFALLARVQGWTPSSLNDFMAEWAMHNVAWDYRDLTPTSVGGSYYRRTYANSASTPASQDHRRYTILKPLSPGSGQFVVPAEWAAQRWGYNLVRLLPDKGTQTVRVSFRGVVQDQPANSAFGDLARLPATISAPDSDWRWGLVAVTKDGVTPRYSPLQRGARSTLEFAWDSTDTSLWMVVVATPSTMQKIRDQQAYFTVYRYPWMMEVGGASPVDVAGKPALPPTAKGKRWPNGGGWVDDAAKVEPTVFVGPDAVVYAGTLSGSARIEGFALVRGTTVADQAVIAGLSETGADLAVRGTARVETTGLPVNAAVTLTGTAQLRGDASLDVAMTGTIDRGVYYGFISNKNVADPREGAARTAPEREVTKEVQEVWIP